VGKTRKDEPRPSRWASLLPFVTVAIALSALFFIVSELRPATPIYDVSYSEFKDLAKEGKIEGVILRDLRIEAGLSVPASLGPKGEMGQRLATRLPSFGDPELVPLLESHRVRIRVTEPEWQALPWALALLPWLLLMLFFWPGRRTGWFGGEIGGPAELRRFLEMSGAKAKVPGVTFDDVAGQKGAKREVSELVAFLEHPDEFQKLGAEVPRGVLLMGAPGTGKTLLARALAGEAGVPFFSISGSEFIEVFVGVGASRVRHLFEAAKKSAPSIIFIDELDSIGRTRGTGLGGGHDEREQTLNQILAEMDGFSGREAVIVLAATNRPDVLDPALLRPGRFDRHVTLDLPDRADRAAILGVHTRKVPLAKDVDLERIAAGTPGFSGADLKNLINEAAMIAAREHRSDVCSANLDEARDKVLLGTVRTLAIQPEERHRLAVHESGHALMAHSLPNADPLYKVTIIPRGRSLGSTQQLPERERYTLPQAHLQDRLAVMLGGRGAEKELLDSLSSGADDDIRQATSLARAMVARWGMSEEIGPVDLRESDEHPFLGREIAQPRRFSEHSAEAVDEAVRKVVREAEGRAGEILHGKRAELLRLVELLEKQETLTSDEIERCLGPRAKDAEVPMKPAVRLAIASSREPRKV